MTHTPTSNCLNEWYRFIFNEVRDGIVLIDAGSGKIIDANPEYQRQTGYRLNELQNMFVWQLRPKEKQDEAERYFRQLTSQGMGSSVEVEFQRPDGSICPVEFFAGITNIEGRAYWLSISRDVTERRRVEEKIRYSENLYRTIFETTGTAMAIDDVNRRLMLVNTKFANLAGYEKEQLEGKRSWTEFVAPEDLERMKESSDERKAHPERHNPSTYEFVWIDRFNNRHNILINSDTLIGTPMTIASLLDITEYKQALVEAEKAQSEARSFRESERLKTELLSMVSHELRTPLTAIKGLVTSLLRKDVCWDPTDERDFLESINREADRLARLIGDLLDMTRLESGSLTMSPDWFRPEEIVSSIQSEIDNLCCAHHFSVSIEPRLPQLFVDITRIGQVLVNLIENSVRFSLNRTEINLKVTHGDGSVVFTVSDSGCGIPAEVGERVFDRFYQLHRGTRGVNGTGLGLAICRAIVEAHQGSIGYCSELGHGSTFWFRIPSGASIDGH
ncbi:sensor histidine kinase [Dehalogenimonas etheniformans]|nr:PAS domain S-box protein [Dehalogenimonas etheniformans]QNT75727.1 PAS domain S-box protein [Dehalogenimonas etheniformans]